MNSRLSCSTALQVKQGPLDRRLNVISANVLCALAPTWLAWRYPFRSQGIAEWSWDLASLEAAKEKLGPSEAEEARLNDGFTQRNQSVWGAYSDAENG